MRALGFGGGACDAVLRLLAFMLKLGNVEFEPVHNIDGSIGTRLQQQYGECGRTRPRPAPRPQPPPRPLTRRCCRAAGGVRAGGRGRGRAGRRARRRRRRRARRGP